MCTCLSPRAQLSRTTHERQPAGSGYPLLRIQLSTVSVSERPSI